MPPVTDVNAVAVTIHTAEGSISADWLDGELWSTTPGTSITPTLFFTNTLERSDPEQRHASLRDYVDAASEKTVRTADADRRPQYYRERTASVDVDSFLARLDAPQPVDIASVWAVIIGGEDTSPPSRDVCVWDAEFQVLRRVEPDDERDAVEAEFTNGVI